MENCSFLGRKRGGVEIERKIEIHVQQYNYRSCVLLAEWGVEEWGESSFPGENFSQNFSYNFSECLYNFITFSHFLYELKHFSENLRLFSENQYPVSKFSVYFNEI